jgi:hypothetical protein
MRPNRGITFRFVLASLLVSGCAPVVKTEHLRHEGPKVNLADFIANTSAYKGKSLTLGLKVEEAIAKEKGQSLRDFVGREVKFAATGPKGEQLNLLIRIPEGMPVPDAGHADELRVTFLCAKGSLQQGNEAKSIVVP